MYSAILREFTMQQSIRTLAPSGKGFDTNISAMSNKSWGEQMSNYDPIKFFCDSNCHEMPYWWGWVHCSE